MEEKERMEQWLRLHEAFHEALGESMQETYEEVVVGEEGPTLEEVRALLRKYAK
jgi:hypothetical protein